MVEASEDLRSVMARDVCGLTLYCGQTHFLRAASSIKGRQILRAQHDDRRTIQALVVQERLVWFAQSSLGEGRLALFKRCQTSGHQSSVDLCSGAPMATVFLMSCSPCCLSTIASLLHDSRSPPSVKTVEQRAADPLKCCSLTLHIEQDV